MKATRWIIGTLLFFHGMVLVPGAALCQGKGHGKPAIAPDIKSTALWDGRKAVEFHALTSPKMVRAAEANFLIDDEYVLGVIGNGESRAYPTRFVSWHHIINDRLGSTAEGKPQFITVTYCSVCNSGISFETPLLRDKPLNFDFYGLYNGVMTMYDTATKSVWLQIGGRAVQGPMLNTTLKTVPVLDTTWGQWKKLHPDTLVMVPERQFKDCYERKGTVMARGDTEFPADYFAPTLTHRDRRLPMFESVLAVSLPSPEDNAVLVADTEVPNRIPALYRAYPMKTFRGKTGVLNDVMGTTPVAVFFQADTETMNVVQRVVAGRTLTLEVRKNAQGKIAFYDKETGTRWSIEGKAEAGRLAGRQLPRVDSHMSQWYGWVSYFPQTTIYGQPDKMSQASLK